MSNKWIRAFRPAAQPPRAARPPPRPALRPTRSFHASATRRAPDDGNNAPRDDGRKPESEASAGEAGEAGAGAEDNLLGEAAVANGESQGRKKPTSGLRSRALRNRRSELPPLQIPKSFLDVAIERHGQTKALLKVDPAAPSRDDPCDTTYPGFEAHYDFLFHVAAWTDRTMLEARRALRRKDGIDRIMKRIDTLAVSAYWAVWSQIKEYEPEGPSYKVLESMPPPQSPKWLQTLFSYPHANRPPVFELYFTTNLWHLVLEHDEIPLTTAAFYEPCIIDEIVAALRAEFLIQPPENDRLANVRRPAIILNGQDISAFSAAQDVLQHAAEKLGADILHLRVHDIAHIIGRYIGQDISRAAGDIALLGYKAAENCGRVKLRPATEEENEQADTIELPFALMVRDDKARKDTKRQTVSMDDYSLNSGLRGKSEELWEDIKINAALDELIHSPDAGAAEQKPLIVHVNDFNALNMEDAGAAIISKIRKIVDDLWLSGRKVVLVGSCSSKDAPVSYQTALAALEANERVIHLSTLNFSNEARNSAHRRRTLALERRGYLRENDENIVRMLRSLTGSSKTVSGHSERTLGLDGYTSGFPPNSRMRPFVKYWDSALPLREIYRVATTMIAVSATDATELFSLKCFEKAAAKLTVADEAREEVAAARSKGSQNTKKDSQPDIPAGMRRNPFAENHEEKLMSGMVNAQDLRTTFNDIHAPRETIESIKMLTTLSLVRPEAFSYGVLARDRIPGCLLYGPPGTGKTLLAKAVAKESGANMIEISGASIMNMYVGESEKNVRALFRLAKKKEPMVIFIDEADALLGARGESRGGGRRETINQFLREWDGMDSMKAFIMVATNRPFDLDEAVLRRLPRKLLIDLPLEADRAAILRIHLKDEVVDEAVSIEDIAKHTPLYSGSDLKNVCVAAAMTAVKEEIEASERHAGPEPYRWAERRVLGRRHFDKALREIGASVSEDMATLTAIRKFDERYGDGKARKKRRGMGFEVVSEAPNTEQARVRSGR
ncbi:hypothetical protein F4802DRAFT_591571 [Xylaria palmicola]|nr:hypothetical protein F4802DRAFT_591571 [Xylaria palmicola]